MPEVTGTLRYAKRCTTPVTTMYVTLNTRWSLRFEFSTKVRVTANSDMQAPYDLCEHAPHVELTRGLCEKLSGPKPWLKLSIAEAPELERQKTSKASANRLPGDFKPPQKLAPETAKPACCLKFRIVRPSAIPKIL